MVRSLAGWDRYFRWNKAIAEVVFSRQAAGTPVYLDLEEEILEAIRDMAEPDATEPGATLPKVVKDTLVLNNEISRVFAGHLQRLELWRDRRTLDPPPTLALLSMLSLAAESMHTGNGMKPNNFYGRLAELLDLNDQKLHWVKSAYRQKVNKRAVSAILWDSLNDWLEMLEGNRGLPTVFALKHAHIGFPLSQALVRQTDRKRFGDLFALNSLPPRSSLPAQESLASSQLPLRPAHAAVVCSIFCTVSSVVIPASVAMLAPRWIASRFFPRRPSKCLSSALCRSP